MKRLTVYLVLAAAALGAAAFSASLAVGAPAAAKANKTMIIVGHELGQKGTDGRLHDTTYGAGFKVKKGQLVTVTVYNFDEGPHTITASGLKLNVTIPGAKNEEKGIPSKTIFTFKATKTGKFRWYCTIPCDKHGKYWAMKNKGQLGFMAGYITVTA